MTIASAPRKGTFRRLSCGARVAAWDWLKAAKTSVRVRGREGSEALWPIDFEGAAAHAPRLEQPYLPRLFRAYEHAAHNQQRPAGERRFRFLEHRPARFPGR